MGGNFSSRRGLKRSHEEEQPEASTSSGTEDSAERELHTPKRKRVQSTSKYIVKTLFEEGVDSDVTIEALGRKWPLHKLYLSQCKYFESMFSGCWTESDQSLINMEIIDENIDIDALKIAFKSLYTDNVFVKPVQAVSVLAAATLLQLDPLIDHCKSVMKGSISNKTVCSFYTASDLYGLTDIKRCCMTWLYHCVMAPSNAPMLSDIREDLLESLLDSHELWALQVEVDVYSLLKKWMFTQLHPNWNGTGEELHRECMDFFKRKAERNNSCFLETEDGRQFVYMFEKVRWMYVINDMTCVQLLRDDKIIPLGWLDPFFKTCWLHHLLTEQGTDIGPSDVGEQDFYKKAMRCGRILVTEQEYHWRWLGYQSGLDLLFTLRNKVLTVKRNSGSMQSFEGSLSQQRRRQIMLCVRVAMCKKKDLWNEGNIKSTGIRTVTFVMDDLEEILMVLAPTVKFPLQITMHLLYISPNAEIAQPRLAVPPPPVDVVPPLSPSASSASMHNGQRQSEGCKRCEEKRGQSHKGDGEPSGSDSGPSQPHQSNNSALSRSMRESRRRSAESLPTSSTSSAREASLSVLQQDASLLPSLSVNRACYRRAPASSGGFSTVSVSSSSSTSAAASSSSSTYGGSAPSDAMLLLSSDLLPTPSVSVTVASMPPSFSLPSASSSNTNLNEPSTGSASSPNPVSSPSTSPQPRSSAGFRSASPSAAADLRPTLGRRTLRTRSRLNAL